MKILWTLAAPNTWTTSGPGIAAVVKLHTDGRWYFRVDAFGQMVASGDFDSAPESKRVAAAHIRKFIKIVHEHQKGIDVLTERAMKGDA